MEANSFWLKRVSILLNHKIK